MRSHSYRGKKNEMQLMHFLKIHFLRCINAVGCVKKRHTPRCIHKMQTILSVYAMDCLTKSLSYKKRKIVLRFWVTLVYRGEFSKLTESNQIFWNDFVCKLHRPDYHLCKISAQIFECKILLLSYELLLLIIFCNHG